MAQKGLSPSSFCLDLSDSLPSLSLSWISVAGLCPAYHSSRFLPLSLWRSLRCCVPVQSFWDTDRSSVSHQCRVCSAATATLHGHGGTPAWRSLLGEPGPPTSLVPGISPTFLPLLLPVSPAERVCHQFGRPTEGAQYFEGGYIDS